MNRLLIATILLLPSITGVLIDPQGDVQLEVTQSPATDLPIDWIDLIEFTIEETQDNTEFKFKFMAEPPGDTGRRIQLNFQHGSVQYKALGTDSTDSAPFLYSRIGDADWTFIGKIGAIHDNGIETIFEVPKINIPDESQISPTIGRELSRFQIDVEPTSFQFTLSPGTFPRLGELVRPFDVAPNSGVPEGSYVFTIGNQTDGNFKLQPLQDIKYSNGAATTYVYDVQLINENDRSSNYEISFQNIPNNWDVTTLERVISLGPGESKLIPVVAAVPFRHDHGTVSQFNILATETETSEIAEAPLFVSFLTIPQPAGHHNTVWGDIRQSYEDVLPGRPFHELQLKAKENDTAESWTRAYGLAVIDEPYQWCLPLYEGLKVGLQFDDDLPGELQTALLSEVPQDGEFSGSLLVIKSGNAEGSHDNPCGFSGRPSIKVGEIGPQTISLQSSQEQQITTEIKTTENKRVEPTAGQDMLLVLHFKPTIPTEATIDVQPKLLSKTKAILPIQEFHEVVQNQQQISIIESDYRVIKRAPGTTAMVPTSTQEAIEVTGTHPWAFVVRSEETVIVIEVPSTAVHGDVASFAVQFEVDGLVGTELISLVVDENAIENDQDMVPAQEEFAPPVSFFMLLGMIFAMAKRSRTD